MPQWNGRIAVGGLLLGSGMLLLNRRLGRQWGATSGEVRMALPGDDVVPQPIWQTTHGISIAAPATAIWPWLVQMGITRGGWYLSAKLDRIVWRIDNPSVDRIVPELQTLSVGDIVPDSVNGSAHFRVVAIEPEHELVLHSLRHPISGVWPDLNGSDPGLYLDFSWAFVLHEQHAAATRLLMRSRARVMRGTVPAPGIVRLCLPLIDFADVVYCRQMLRGIRRRVAANLTANMGSGDARSPASPECAVPHRAALPPRTEARENVRTRRSTASAEGAPAT
jgi:hypothetical protein